MYEALGNLSLDLLRAFEAAARHRSFTAAAVELGTTQPAISQQIKRLEEQLGARLFDRIYRGIELTEGGAILFEQVQLGLQHIDAGLSAISTQQQHEVLQVATDFAFAAYWLMPRLHRFHEANPNVDVSLVTSERSHNMLRTDIDVAILLVTGASNRAKAIGCSAKKCSRCAARNCSRSAPCLCLPRRCWSFRCCICAGKQQQLV